MYTESQQFPSMFKTQKNCVAIEEPNRGGKNTFGRLYWEKERWSNNKQTFANQS